MTNDIFNLLVEKMTLHFPLREGGVAGHGFPRQEPYKKDLLTIFLRAFASRDKRDQYDLSWERFEEKLKDAVLKNSPHLHREQLKDIFDLTGDMWEEWLYFALRIRKGEEEATLTLVNYGPIASYFISVE
ncbi:MAG: hypothetical protein ACOH2E_04860 [Candidatus Paracaedibacter sp.]